MVLAFLFLSHTYIGMLTAKRGEAKRVYREKTVKASGKVGALVRRELFRFLSAPYYIFNEGLGLFFAPVLGVFALLKGGELIGSLMADSEMSAVVSMFIPSLPATMAATLCLLGSMCIISAPSLSIEGKSLWIAKSLPVRAGDVLCAKAYMHVLVTLPFFVPTSLMLVIALAGVLPLGFFDVVVLFLLPFAFNCLCAFVGIALNFAFPRFDYPTLNAAVKSGASVLITMLAMIVLAIGVSFLASIAFVAPSVLLTVLALAFLGICALLRSYFYGAAAEERFAKLGQ